MSLRQVAHVRGSLDSKGQPKALDPGLLATSDLPTICPQSTCSAAARSSQTELVSLADKWPQEPKVCVPLLDCGVVHHIFSNIVVQSHLRCPAFSQNCVLHRFPQQLAAGATYEFSECALQVLLCCSIRLAPKLNRHHAVYKDVGARSARSEQGDSGAATLLR